MPPEENVKLIALYFPQFHCIPENDAWWGRGFTDWTNVKRAKAQFSGHYQPRVPKDGRYYDQSQLETIKWQVDLAKAHGLYGFCHYHYWFDGKQLLETPTNLMLEHKEIDFPFCLAWANETWSRRWDGLEGAILIEQTYTATPAAWERHFEYLYRAWSDPRAIRIDGRPVFMIYRPHLVKKLAEMLDYWRYRAKEKGLPGLFLVAMKQYEYPQPDLLKLFDGSMHFQPFEALASPDFRPWLSPESVATSSTVHTSTAQPEPGTLKRYWRKLPVAFRFAFHTWRRCFATVMMLVPLWIFSRLQSTLQTRLSAIRAKKIAALLTWDYDSMWNQMLKVERDHGLPTFPGAFVDWDNTPRYRERARLFRGASPERFRFWFEQLVKITATRPENERYIFINAWNEWAEGTYLEPDERYGTQHLEIVRDVLAAQGKSFLKEPNTSPR